MSAERYHPLFALFDCQTFRTQSRACRLAKPGYDRGILGPPDYRTPFTLQSPMPCRAYASPSVFDHVLRILSMGSGDSEGTVPDTLSVPDSCSLTSAFSHRPLGIFGEHLRSSSTLYMLLPLNLTSHSDSNQTAVPPVVLSGAVSDATEECILPSPAPRRPWATADSTQPYPAFRASNWSTRFY